MEKIKIVIFFLLFSLFEKSLLGLPVKKAVKNKPPYEFFAHSKELNLEKKLSLSKIFIIPTILSVIVFYNKQNVLNNIKENPVLSAIGLCLFAIFFLDTIDTYYKISYNIDLLYLSQTISRYILYAIAIKNTMLQIAKKDSCCSFQEEDFLKTITCAIPLSFHELELFSFELLHNCIKTIHTMHIKIHTDVEEKIYLLCKDHVTLEDVLDMYHNDNDEFYPDLQKVSQNPTEYYKTAALKLNTLIKKNLQYIINHQSNPKEKL